jgi:plastocyanin
MLRNKTIRGAALAFAATAALAVTSGAQAHNMATVTIRHQMRGCHTWSFANGPFQPTLSFTVKSGTELTVVNNDVMPHKLIQTAGPKLRLTHANMNHMSASTSFTPMKKGLYRFTTKAGEDYPSMGEMHTMGKDYVLHMTLRVK